MNNYEYFTRFVRGIFNEPEAFIPLHAPIFIGNEKRYLNDCINTTFVSYVGKYVTQFEEIVADYIGVKYATALVNGTAALHLALQISGVKANDLVLTQALTFVATANAISHAGAAPVFVDSEFDHLGMDPEKLSNFLKEECGADSNGKLIHKLSGRRITACVPVHIFGHPSRIDEIVGICNQYNLPVVEDAAESIGSKFNNQHMGTFGLMGILSFNGNKTITTGGGGMIVTNNEELAKRARHLTTTAKISHPYEFYHDEVAYNYRLTNLNAAVGVAQMEQLDMILKNKRQLAEKYSTFFKGSDILFFREKTGCQSNYWLNTIFLKNRGQRDEFLRFTNEKGVMTRPAWILMNKLPMYKNCITTELSNAQWLEDRLVNLPSSYIPAIEKDKILPLT